MVGFSAINRYARKGGGLLAQLNRLHRINCKDCKSLIYIRCANNDIQTRRKFAIFLKPNPRRLITFILLFRPSTGPLEI